MMKCSILLVLPAAAMILLSGCGSSRPDIPAKADLYGYVVDSARKDTVSSGTVRLFYRGMWIRTADVNEGRFRFSNVNTDLRYDLEYTEVTDTVVLGRVSDLELEEQSNTVTLQVNLNPPQLPLNPQPPPNPLPIAPKQ
jgi:hypothetical protein